MRRLNLQGVFMKSWSIQGKICIAILAIILNISFADVSYSASKSVKPQLAGRTATSVSNTILNGITSPKSTQGINGDFFIDTKALTIYGPKASGRWPVGISLRGTQGVAGTTGTSGSNGTDGRNAQSASAVVGAQGATGAAGIKGEAGVAGTTGAQGVAGATGSAGIAGAQGSPGATGNTGVQGNIGNTGSAGAQGLKGETGNAGAEGSKGETGTVGATGPSSALFGVIGFADHISGGGFPSQSSNAFGSFEADKDYAVRFHIFVVDPSQIVDFSLSIEFTATGATPTMTKMYSISKGFIWNGVEELQGVSIIGEVSIEGSTAHSTYNLIATVTTGTTVGTHPLTLTGNFQKVIVGEVTQTS